MDTPEPNPANEEALKVSRWSLVTTLVWISTRDVSLTSMTIAAPRTLHRTDIRLDLENQFAISNGLTSPIKLTLADAWQNELAPALAKSSLTGFATKVESIVTGGLQSSVAGVPFPPDNQRGLALTYKPCDARPDGIGGIVLRPQNYALVQSWSEFQNVDFAREDVLRIWPMETTARTVGDDKDANSLEVWTHVQAAAWLGTQDANVTAPFTLSPYFQDEGEALGKIAGGWRLLLNALQSGKIVASSLEGGELKSSFWRYVRTDSIAYDLGRDDYDGQLVDVFRPTKTSPERHTHITILAEAVRNLVHPTGLIAQPATQEAAAEQHQVSSETKVPQFRNKQDRTVYYKTLEKLSFDGSTPLAQCVRDAATELGCWPADEYSEQQERLIGRIRKAFNRHKDN